MTEKQRQECRRDTQLALQAMNRGLRKAFLEGSAYDPDGSGKAYWEEQDRLAAEVEASKLKKAS